MNLQVITLLNVEVQPIFQLLDAGRVLQETFTLPKGFETTTIPKGKRGKEFILSLLLVLEGKTQLLFWILAQTPGRTHRAGTGGSRRHSWGAGAR